MLVRQLATAVRSVPRFLHPQPVAVVRLLQGVASVRSRGLLARRVIGEDLRPSTVGFPMLRTPSRPARSIASSFDRTVKFLREVHGDPLHALLFSRDRPEPFAALHPLADDGL